MKQEKKTEAVIDRFISEVSVNGSGDLCPTVLAEIHGLRSHARDLARKLDAIMVAIAPPSCDVSTEYYRGRVEAFSAACGIIEDDTHGIASTGQRFEYDPQPLPLLNPGLEN